MRIELTLKNYRCFPDSNPARIVIEDGIWTAFVGENNAGKSTLLRFFYEFRPFFSHFGDVASLRNLLKGRHSNVGFGDSVKDASEVYHNQNGRPMTLVIEVEPPDSGLSGEIPSLFPLTVEFHRTPAGQFQLSQASGGIPQSAET